MLQIDDWLTRKKSSLQWMSGCRRCQVYLMASGLRIRHASDSSLGFLRNPGRPLEHVYVFWRGLLFCLSQIQVLD